jgi:hypothetical protein
VFVQPAPFDEGDDGLTQAVFVAAVHGVGATAA